MKITLHTITIKKVVDGYEDKGEEGGIFGYGGKLNIRPKFQREFFYKKKQKEEVIRSVFKGFPLNVMYWVKNAEGGFELLDGQQRTMSICSYYKNQFSIKVEGSTRGFPNLTPEQKERFLDYELQVYICEDGTAQEQLDWFQVINYSGEQLLRQELRNAIYAGPWITDAKRKFSKTGCAAWGLGKDYMEGVPLRQAYLETVLRWISKNDIENYMAEHQNDCDAAIEWQYFQLVIGWVKTLFPTYRKEMKGVEWGELYNRYKGFQFSHTELEEEVKDLMLNSDVTNRKGIYEYVLSRDERCLNIRAFDIGMKQRAYARQNGICANCHKPFRFEEMEGDHITPWSLGGKTNEDNCRMLCKDCNRIKSNH